MKMQARVFFNGEAICTDTVFNDQGVIRSFSNQIIRLQEELVQEALQSLGWSNPVDTEILQSKVAELEQVRENLSVLDLVPDLRDCCGSLCNKKDLISQIETIVWERHVLQMKVNKLLAERKSYGNLNQF